MEIDNKLHEDANEEAKRPREFPEKEATEDAAPARKKPRREDQKCAKCKKRLARRACTQQACISCCSDLECQGHKEARENAQWKEAVLAGTTDIQIRAKAKRNNAVLPGAFREPGFIFLNQSIEIWNRKKFMANRKWRDDAIRRADKRRARMAKRTAKPIRNSVRRFQRVMNDLYRKSLVGKEDKLATALDAAKKAVDTIGKGETEQQNVESGTGGEDSTPKKTSPGCKMS